MKFEFLNEDHRKSFQELREGLSENRRFDEKYLSVCFLMAGSPELFRKMNPYFDGVEGSLKSDKMFEEQDFSSSFGILAKLAVHLFNSNEKVSPLDLVEYLDKENFQLAINAIILRRYGISRSYPLKSE
jgi:hypothetical protein